MQTTTNRRPGAPAKPVPVEERQIPGTVRIWTQKGDFVGSFHQDDQLLITVEQQDGSRVMGRMSVESVR